MTMQAPADASSEPTLLAGRRSNVIPIILTAVFLVVFIGAVVNVTVSLNEQVERGQIALSLQQSEQDNSFRQLQRESLRLIALLNLPVESLDREAVQLQIDLLSSRFFQMDAVANHPATRPQEADIASGLSARGGAIIGDAELWLEDPEDEALRQSLIADLSDVEREVNQHILDFARVTNQAVIAFRDATNRTQSAFGIAAFSFVLLTLALLYNIYLYFKQIQETEAARQSIRFKDQFLAVMSHELRTPLNAIIGFLGIMKMQGPGSERLPHMIDRARANAERLLNLIDDILDISKIEAGRFELHTEPVTIRDLVTRWNTQAEILAQEKGIFYQSRVDPKMPQQVMVDIDAVTKIATNLLSNALKFTEKGTVILSVEYLTDQWRIAVEDTGIGISADQFDTIFESFRQLDGSIRRTFGGSGLGLSIVRQLAHLQGGEVDVKSTEGAGSTFLVTLPLTPVPEKAPTPEATPVAAS